VELDRVILLKALAVLALLYLGWLAYAVVFGRGPL